MMKLSSTSTHEQITTALGIEIVSGKRPVDSVMTLKELELEFAVSRTTIREAIRVLEGLQLVKSKRRVGISILPRHLWRMTDARVISWRMADSEQRLTVFREIGDLRRCIEPEAARLAALNSSTGDAERLAANAREMRQLGRDGRGATDHFRELDIAFHAEILRLSGNEFFISLSGMWDALLNERSKYGLQPDYPDEMAMDAHVSMAESILVRDTREALHMCRQIVDQADSQVQAKGLPTSLH